NPHPVPSNEQQDDEDDSVNNPKDIESQVEPQRQADLLFKALWRDICAGLAFVSDLDAGANDQHHEEHVEEVLPAQPYRNANGCAFRKSGVSVIAFQEVRTEISAEEVARTKYG
ncbi:hypothetical protein, partial [Corynebacterium casei]|uniref:hypothetical protein n=1 Tax=Corynebacterium casei TaxID=160386 RepID=UPI0026479B18